MQKLRVPGRLPGLNEVIAAKGNSRVGKRGGRWDAYQGLKRETGQTIALLAIAQRFRVEGKAFTYVFAEPDRRRDPSNFIAGGVKLIEDALQGAGLLENDGWDQVGEIRAHWCVNKAHPAVFLISGAETLDRQAAIEAVGAEE